MTGRTVAAVVRDWLQRTVTAADTFDAESDGRGGGA
jgi:hypothetical protein